MEHNSLQSLAAQIVDQLQAHGHSAYFVGGFVRDQLLGRVIKDIDIATSAVPEQVMALFERAEPTGLQHGTVTVIREGIGFEVTTYRSEAGYSDYRRPDQVRFIDTIEEDLSRRDFTMNAMALSRSGELIDPYGGQHDLQQRCLRAVGDAALRFNEDALRMLRCIRFAAEYALQIEPFTWQALVKHAHLIRNIALERVRAELERMMEGSDPEYAIELLGASGLVRHFPVMEQSGLSTALDQLSLDQSKCSLLKWSPGQTAIERWASIFMVCGYGEGKQVQQSLLNWTFAKQKAADISNIAELHQQISQLDAMEEAELELIWKRFALQYRERVLRFWLSIMQHAIHSQHLDSISPLVRTLLLVHGDRWLKEMPVFEIKQLAVNGHDLIQLGLMPGPELGMLLNQLLERVALGQVNNDADQLLTEVRRLRKVKSE